MTFGQILWWLFRIAALLLLIFLAVRLSSEVRELIAAEPSPQNSQLLNRLTLLGLIAYALLTSIPFVPGAEIGMALLVAVGPSIAPMVYLATVAALLLAYWVGRLVPPAKTAPLLRGMRLKRAADQLDEIATLPQSAVIEHLFSKTNPGLTKFVFRYRYLAIVLLINLPGSIVVGGGGGIAMAAGLSRVFRPLGFMISVLIGVLPGPLAFVLISNI